MYRFIDYILPSMIEYLKVANDLLVVVALIVLAVIGNKYLKNKGM